MQRFEFQLEKALEWRMARLKEEEAKLTTLFRERDTLLRNSAALEEAAGEMAKIIPECSAQIKGADLGLMAECVSRTKSRLNKLAQQARDCDSRIEQQTRAVMEANRQKQLLEDLKQERMEEWNYEVNRETEATAGELFLTRWTAPARRLS
jgi:hypothetical protein